MTRRRRWLFFHNIRVNAVGPGSIDTAMMAGVNANPKLSLAQCRGHLSGGQGPRVKSGCGRLLGQSEGQLYHR